ncbi:hypothetical protein N7540_013214 [Penicillium herquei]|nr:hypothetical protein N7540_013214 [Penicillium herquei]
MATQASVLPNLADLQSQLRKFPEVFELSDDADIYLTPTIAGLQADCDSFFLKKSSLTPSEMFLAVVSRPDVDPRAKSVLISVVNCLGGERFIGKEPEGLTKIVKSIGKTVSVLLSDIAPYPFPAVLDLAVARHACRMERSVTCSGPLRHMLPSRF